MSGYRQHSFDPYAYEQAGRPLRPFNRVQWTGVVLGTTGLALTLAYLAGEVGWIAPVVKSNWGFVPMILGVVLINSRREPATLVGSEQLRRNRKVLAITVAALAVIFGAAITISYFTGA